MTSSLSAPPVRRSVLAALCCAVMMLYSVYLGAVGVLLPYLGAAFRLGTEAQGRLFPANFAGFVVGVLLCGYLSDRLGRKAVLLAGSALYAAGLVLFGVAQSFPVALAASALVGAGSGAMEVVASALAADLYPEKRAFLLNAIQVAFGAGAAISPALVSQSLQHGADWRMLYLGLAVANALVFVALASQRVPGSAASESMDLRSLRAVLQKPAFAMLCLTQAAYVGGEVSFFSWMPTYFQEALPGGAKYFGTVATVFWVLMTVGRFVVGGLIGRLPLLRLNALLAAGGAVSAALAVVSGSPIAILVFVGLAGLCFSGIFSLVLAEAGERFPSVAGTAFGGVVASGGIGGAVVPWIVSALAASGWGWSRALLIVPVMLGIVAALSQILERKR